MLTVWLWKCSFTRPRKNLSIIFVNYFYQYRLSIWDVLSVLFWNRVFSSWPSCFYFPSAGITGGRHHIHFVILSFSTSVVTSDFSGVTCLCYALPFRYCCITFANILWRMFKSVWKMLVCSFLFCVILILGIVLALWVRKWSLLLFSDSYLRLVLSSVMFWIYWWLEFSPWVGSWSFGVFISFGMWCYQGFSIWSEVLTLL